MANNPICCKRNRKRIQETHAILEVDEKVNRVDDAEPLDLVLNLLHLLEADGRDVTAFLAGAASHWKMVGGAGLEPATPCL